MKDQQAKQQQQAAAAQQQQQQHPESAEEKQLSPGAKHEDEEEAHDEPNDEEEAEQDAESEEESGEGSEEESEEEEDDLEELYQLLVGKKVNKSGMVVDKKSGAVLGRLVYGKARKLAGKKVGENGEIVNEKGKVIGRVEPVQQDDEKSNDDEESNDDEPDADAQQQDEQQEGGQETPATDHEEDDHDAKKQGESPEQKKEEDVKVGAAVPEEEEVTNKAEGATKETEDSIDVPEELEGDNTEKAEDTTEKAEDATEKAEDATKETEDSIDAPEELEGDTAEKAEDTTEKAEDATEKAEDATEKAEDATKETEDSIDAPEELEGDTAEKVEDAGDKAEGAAEDTKDEVADKAEDAPTDEEAQDLDVGDRKEQDPAEKINEDSPVVKKSGKVLDMDDNVVGHVDKRLASKLVGCKVDEEGNVINEDGEIVGVADMIKPEEPVEDDKPFNPNEMVDVDSPEVKKSGKVLDMDDNLIGHIDKKLAPKLAGFKVDPSGNVVNHEGHIVAKAEMIKQEEEPEEEEKPVEEEKSAYPNEAINEESPEVRKSGKVFDMDDNLVGHIDKKLAPKLAGFKVDEDGNVYDQEGHIVAKADMIKPEVEEENKPFNPNELVDEDSPEVRKSGKVVDMEDNIVGSVDKRVAAKYAGCKVDPEGNVINNDGHIVARAEMIKEEEPVEEEKSFNPNDMVNENSPEVRKSGKVVDMEDNVVGSVDKRMAAKWVGFKVDEEGNVINNEGHVAGKADMIKPVEEKKPFNPNTAVDEHSPEVRRSGKVVDEDDNIVGTVEKSAAHKLAGFKVDYDGNIIDHEGHIVGKADMIKQMSEEERKEKEEEDEYRRIADQMAQAVQHSLDKIRPVLKMITENIDAEEAKSKDDRDEEKLVETVKPLIEQGSAILEEAYGAIRGLDPSGKIAKSAQAKTSQRKASPEEYHLAELLSQLTGDVTTTIDRAKKKIKNMPHAKKALSPLWNILQSPLLQILSAVGLLLSGVLGLVGNILNGLGLGGIVNGLLGGLGLNKILESFGLGDALNLAGKKK